MNFVTKNLLMICLSTAATGQMFGMQRVVLALKKGHTVAGIAKPVRALHTRALEPASFESLKADYTQRLKAREAELWQEIFTKTGVSRQDCHNETMADKERVHITCTMVNNKIKIERKKVKAQSEDAVTRQARALHMITIRDLDENVVYQSQLDFPLLSEKTVTIINEIVQAMGVTKPFTLIAWEHEGIAAVGNNGPNDLTMYIDEQRFQKLSLQEQRFIIAHEVTHILHNDPAWSNALGELLSKDTNKELYQISKELYHTFERFQEERADITANLQGIPYTAGAITFFDACLQQGEDTTSSSHPPVSYRKAIAQKIAEQLKQVSR